MIKGDPPIFQLGEVGETEQFQNVCLPLPLLAYEYEQCI